VTEAICFVVPTVTWDCAVEDSTNFALGSRACPKTSFFHRCCCNIWGQADWHPESSPTETERGNDLWGE
jgi:hypothetical protein